MVVNAHGFGFIAGTRLKDKTLVLVTLVSSGANKKGWVVFAISVLESSSWLLGVEFESPGNFWEVEHPPADWLTQGASLKV